MRLELWFYIRFFEDKEQGIRLKPINQWIRRLNGKENGMKNGKILLNPSQPSILKALYFHFSIENQNATTLNCEKRKWSK